MTILDEAMTNAVIRKTLTTLILAIEELDGESNACITRFIEVANDALAEDGIPFRYTITNGWGASVNVADA